MSNLFSLANKTLLVTGVSLLVDFAVELSWGWSNVNL